MANYDTSPKETVWRCPCLPDDHQLNQEYTSQHLNLIEEEEDDEGEAEE